MQKPRCGVPDKFKSASRSRKRRYALTGQKWQRTHITYRCGACRVCFSPPLALPQPLPPLLFHVITRCRCHRNRTNASRVEAHSRQNTVNNTLATSMRTGLPIWAPRTIISLQLAHFPPQMKLFCLFFSSSNFSCSTVELKAPSLERYLNILPVNCSHIVDRNIPTPILSGLIKPTLLIGSEEKVIKGSLAQLQIDRLQQ